VAMGTWGAGNLESDNAAEYLLYQIFEPLEEQIRSVLEDDANAEADEDGDATMVAVDALAALCAHFGETTQITRKKLVQIQKKYLKVWSKSMDGLEPVEGHKSARQTQIEATFARLLDYAK
jgi:hypothetical protein